MLQDGDAERRIEGRVGEGQPAGIGGSEMRVDVVGLRGRPRGGDAIDQQVDGDEIDLGQTQPRELHLRGAGAAADVQDPRPGRGCSVSSHELA